MVTARRKEREKEDRRNRIIDAAETLFIAKGFDDVSMDEVAQDAELAKGTLYLYFKNKESLFYAVALRGARILNEMFKNGVKKGKNGAEKLYSTGTSYYDFYRQYPDHYRIFAYTQLPTFNGSEKSAREINRLAKENVDLMCDCIREGQADGSIRDDIDPAKTAWFLILASEGIINQSACKMLALESQGISQDDFVMYSLGLMGGAISITGKWRNKT
jgi:TetR/AcrR family transcriptional regulator